MSYTLPALRGNFGSWIYYSSMMPLQLIASHVSMVKDIHKNHALSDMIQRSYRPGRFNDIKEYLLTQDDRFFNSLVLAVYDGVPNWYPAGVIEENATVLSSSLPEQLMNSFGFLSFSGSESIIAVDGQHRLGGIKALGVSLQDSTDLAPVIFISHDKSDLLRMQRTRRLFTTLNKHAQPVNKNDIIALDENDLMAIITRRLVEDNPWFSDGKVKINKAGSKIADNDSAFTSIENLYDILTVLFTKVLPYALPDEYRNQTGRDLKRMLKNGRRLSDKWLDKCYQHAIEYFAALAELYPELKTFFDAPVDDFGGIAKIARIRNRCIAFRPVGLNIITNLLAQLDGSLADRLERISSLPKSFDKSPYAGLVWTERDGMDEKKEPAVRNLLLFALKGGAVNNLQKISAKRAWSLLTGEADVSETELPRTIQELSAYSA